MEHERRVLLEESYLNTVMKEWEANLFAFGTGRRNQDFLLVETGV